MTGRARVGDVPPRLLRLPLIDGLTWPVRLLGLTAGAALILATATLQSSIYPDLPIAVLYVLPVVLVTWVGGAWAGAVAAVAAAGARAAADHFGGTVFSHPSVPWWNFVISAALYLVLTFLLARLHRTLLFEQQLARTDPLTSLGNRRFFEQVAGVELNRSMRYRRPFAVAYLDVDRFKEFNDRFGHAAGDRLLRDIAAMLVHSLRASDIVARLGGDEFSMLLPETPPDGARIAMEKAHELLTAGMVQRSYDVSFSVGVITYDGGHTTLAALLEEADRVMYAVKRNGRGSVRCKAYEVVATG